MRRILSLTLISLVTALGAACGGGTQPPENPSKATDENPCPQPTTPPKEGETPTCTEGCVWDGTACKQQRGVIIHDAHPQHPPHPTTPGGPPDH